jgi:hypothetical protein
MLGVIVVTKLCAIVLNSNRLSVLMLNVMRSVLIESSLLYAECRHSECRCG